MSWLAVGKAVYDRAVADTGSGGLFYTSGNQVIRAWYSNEGALNAPLPYCVASLVSQVEDDVFPTANRTVTVSFDVGVFHDKAVASAHTKHQATIDRIVSLLRRWQPTISGYTVSQVIYEGSPFTEPSDQALYSVLSFRVVLST